MSETAVKSSYPLKLPISLKENAKRLAQADGVSLNQWIAVAIAEKIGVVQTAQEFLNQKAAGSRAKDLLPFLDRAGKFPAMEADRL